MTRQSALGMCQMTHCNEHNPWTNGPSWVRHKSFQNLVESSPTTLWRLNLKEYTTQTVEVHKWWLCPFLLDLERLILIGSSSSWPLFLGGIIRIPVIVAHFLFAKSCCSEKQIPGVCLAQLCIGYINKLPITVLGVFLDFFWVRK